jgi:hypothetical protein
MSVSMRASSAINSAKSRHARRLDWIQSISRAIQFASTALQDVLRAGPWLAESGFRSVRSSEIVVSSS